MRMFTIGRFLRCLFTATGLLAIALQLARPQWEVHLAGGHTARPHTWFWSAPDLGASTATSFSVDWLPTLGPAVGMAICTLLWWRSTGRLERREAAQLEAAAIAAPAQ